jgi:hypothetical protein
MELKDLVGNHLLTGVDNDSEKLQTWGEYFEDCQVIRFTLDNVTYMAIEDPDDGYRSHMKELVVSEEPTKNIFTSISVIAQMKEKEEEEYPSECDILELVDSVT